MTLYADTLFSGMSYCNIIIMTLFRDLAEFGMGMNVPPPVMSREEFEARKADLRRKRENERRGERYKWNFSWVAMSCSDMHV